jgi:exopolysaccharide production protein ExoQ
LFINPGSRQSSAETPLGADMARAIATLALLIPPLAVLVPKGLIWVALVPALALMVRDARARALAPHWPGRFALILLAVIVWSALSALWAVRPDETLSKLAAFAAYAVGAVALLGAGRMMTEAQRRMLARALTVGLFVAFGLLAIERSFGVPIMGAAKDLSKLNSDELYSIYNRGLGISALLIWPATLVLWRSGKRAAAAALPALLTALAVAFGAWSVFIGLGAALIAAAVVGAGSRSMPRMLGALAVIAVLVQPFVANWAIDRFAPANRAAISNNVSINHRFITWEFASARIMDRPLTGYGGLTGWQ